MSFEFFKFFTFFSNFSTILVSWGKTKFGQLVNLIELWIQVDFLTFLTRRQSVSFSMQ